MLLFGSCITKVPNRTTHDFSQTYGVADFQNLHPEIAFQVLQESDLDSLIRSEPKVVFLLFATWCPPCYSQLINGAYRQKALALDPIPLVPIFVNYDLEDWDSFHADRLPPKIYFLANPDQVTEVQQIIKVRQRLCPDCDSITGVPQFFWFSDGELVSTKASYQY